MKVWCGLDALERRQVLKGFLDRVVVRRGASGSSADLAPETPNPNPTVIGKPLRDEDAMVCIAGRRRWANGSPASRRR